MYFKKCVIAFCFIFILINLTNANVDNTEIGLQEQSVLYNVAQVARKFENNGSKCNSELQEFVDALKLKESWALKMLDASGQEETGYLFTNFIWIGSMSLCYDLNNKQIKENHSPYDVDFISILLSHNNSMQIQMYSPNNEFLQIALCVPKSCQLQDIKLLVNEVLLEEKLSFLQIYPVRLSIEKLKSLNKENLTWTKTVSFNVTMFIFLLTLGLSILGSLYDTYVRQPHLEKIEKMKIEGSENSEIQEPTKKMFGENKLWSKILLCYSVPANMKSIFNTSSKNDDSMPVIHGLKAIGMFYIVAVHYTLYISMAFKNNYDTIRNSALWYYQILTKSAFSVDTYFCLGGFLVSYLFFKYHKDKKPYTLLQGIKVFFQMVAHRVIRLLPAYLVTIFLVMAIWNYMEQSYPMFRLVDAAEEICPNYWWRNLLFLTTFHPRTEMCITWTWYLSEDMQFYIVNCALLLISLRYLKQVIYFMKFMVLYSICATAWISYNIRYKPTLPAQMREEVMYYTFSIRMAPYFIGIISGYYFHKWGGKLPLTKSGIYKGWLLFILAAIFVIQSIPAPNQASLAFNTFHVATSRTLWGAGIAWFMMACVSGYGGIVNKFCSFTGWIPFSKITFCVYLTNIIIVNIYGYSSEASTYFAINHEFFLMPGNILFCFFVGLVFSLLIESPFVQLLKILMTPTKKKAKKEDVTINHEIASKKQLIIKDLKKNIRHMN